MNILHAEMISASHVIEYFATLGRRKTLVCKQVDSSNGIRVTKNATEVWNEAITDIAIIQPGEQLPDAWEAIEASVDGGRIPSSSVIAVRRRIHSKRLDHITKVLIQYENILTNLTMTKHWTDTPPRCTTFR